jgi:hypothetical protein
MRMLRLKRELPTRSLPTQRPRRSEPGSVARIAFGPATHCFRAEARIRRPRMSKRRACAGLLMRARATSLRTAPRRSTEILTPVTTSGCTCGWGAGGGGGVGAGGGAGGGGSGCGGGGGGGGGAAAATTTSAFMPWGNEQWYANVPSVANVWRKDWPCVSAPESKAPVSDVAVCEAASLFVQHTVWFGATVTDAGEYEKPLISIRTSDTSHGPGAASAPCPAQTATPTTAAHSSDNRPSALINRYTPNTAV